MVLPNPKTTFKALLLDYDALIEASDAECCFSLSEREIQMMLAFVEYIGWKTRYIATETEIDQDLILRWQGNLARKLMSGCCPDDGTLSRYTEDGVFQTSDDGGLTWHDNPGADPRNNTTQAPPLDGEDGDDKKCIAATAGADFAKSQLIDSLTTGMSYAEINAALVGVVLILGVTGVGILITAIASLIFIAGVAVVQAAFTTEVWDRLKCNFYCNMSDDASFTPAQWIAVLTQLNTDETGIVNAILHQWIVSMGNIGLTNLVRSHFADEGDCSDCDCNPGWCYEIDFTVTDGDFTAVFGSWSGGVGWSGTAAGSGVSVVIDRTLPSANYTKITMDVNCPGTCNVALQISGQPTFGEINVATGTYVWEGDLDGTLIEPNPSSGSAQGATVNMTRLRFEGMGDNPFGDDNCE